MYCIQCKENREFDMRYIGFAGSGEYCLTCEAIKHNRVIPTPRLLTGIFWTTKEFKIIKE
jgi:hypothetical protein